MSEQGKIVRRYRAGNLVPDEKGDFLNYRHHKKALQKIASLEQQLTAAETAATEYAQQAAELQEEVERLKSLWIEYRNATDEGSNYSILAELFKRFDNAIRETE